MLRSIDSFRGRWWPGGSPKGRLVFPMLLLGLLLLAPLRSAAQEADGGAIPIGDFRLQQPIERSLSSSTWVMTQGYDPRLLGTPIRSAAGGVDWGSTAAAPSGGARGGAFFAPPVPFRSAAPAFSRNQIVTRQVGLFPVQTEPHIAVDPFDPEHLVLGAIDYNFPSMSSYVSFDGGETWDGPNQVRYFQEDISAAGDPVVAFDRAGNVYMVSISLGLEEFRIGSLVSETEVSSMVIAKSTDDGYTWKDAVSAARSTIETESAPDDAGRERGVIKSQFLDKPWIAIGPSPDDPDSDVIYLTYTEFETSFTTIYADELPFLTSPSTETTIRMVKSEDGGGSWSDPAAISPTVLQAEGASEEPGGEAIGRGDADNTAARRSPPATTAQQQNTPAAEGNQTVQGSQPAVMADGTLVMTYLDTTNDGVQEGLCTIMVVTSKDGGETLSDPVTAGIFKELHFQPRSSTFRFWGAGFPQLAVGSKGEIYIATTARPPDKAIDDGDIFLMRSMDTGKTWQEPVRLNQDDTDRLQFFPSLSVSPNGVLHAMWGDMRDDPDEVRYNIYYTRSDDKGETFGFKDDKLGINVPDTRVTDFASNSLRGFPGGRFIGDYFSIAAADEDVYMVWADTRLGEFGGANQQIGFARQTAIAPPELFLNPASGVAGRDVTIQGFRFQPNSDIAIDVGGIGITNLRSNEKGEFQTNVYMPVTGEGPRNVAAYDVTGNVATASFFTEFGFDSIAREIGALKDAVGQGAAGAPAVPPPAPLPSPPADADNP